MVVLLQKAPTSSTLAQAHLWSSAQVVTLLRQLATVVRAVHRLQTPSVIVQPLLRPLLPQVLQQLATLSLLSPRPLVAALTTDSTLSSLEGEPSPPSEHLVMLQAQSLQQPQPLPGTLVQMDARTLVNTLSQHQVSSLVVQPRNPPLLHLLLLNLLLLRRSLLHLLPLHLRLLARHLLSHPLQLLRHL